MEETGKDGKILFYNSYKIPIRPHSGKNDNDPG